MKLSENYLKYYQGYRNFHLTLKYGIARCLLVTKIKRTKYIISKRSNDLSSDTYIGIEFKNQSIYFSKVNEFVIRNSNLELI